MDDIEDIVEDIQSYLTPKQVAEETSYDIVGYGASRVVIRQDAKSVVKIAMNSQGHRENKTESNIYQSAQKNGFVNILVPVTDYSDNGRWIEMPYIGQTEPGAKKFTGPSAVEIKNKLENYGFQLYELESCIYEGSPSAYDYGCLA